MTALKDALDHLTREDFNTFCMMTKGYPGEPLVIAPEGEPYLYRWCLVPRNDFANIYLHLQVLSDPMRPLHDHPWDNQSVILSGGYNEWYDPHADDEPWYRADICSKRLPYGRELRKGDVVTRKAETAHRLILPPDIPYALAMFATGPKRREWGFWYPDGWHNADQHVRKHGGVSVHTGE